MSGSHHSVVRAAALGIGVLLAAPALAQDDLAEVEASVIWIGTVEQGELVRQVRGPGVMERFGRGFHAHVRIAARQAPEVQLDQSAIIDTRASKLAGRVVHINDRVEEGTVSLVVEITDDIPESVIPGLAVDARIQIEQLADVVFVSRPAFGQANQTTGIFKLTADGDHAERVAVTWGASSVDMITVAAGLDPGDQIILSDMSRFDTESRVRIVR
jgi:HlyD family secretion protein